MRIKLLLAPLMIVLAGLLALMPSGGVTPAQASPSSDEPEIKLLSEKVWQEYVDGLNKSEYWKRLIGLRDAALTEGLEELAPEGYEVHRNTVNSIEMLSDDGVQVSLSDTRAGYLGYDSVEENDVYTIRYTLVVGEVDGDGDMVEEQEHYHVPASRLLPLSFSLLSEVRLVHPLNKKVNLATTGRGSTASDVIRNLCKDAKLDFVIDESRTSEIWVQLRDRTVSECIQHVCNAGGYVVSMSAKGIAEGASYNEVVTAPVNQAISRRLDRGIDMDDILGFYGERESLLATRRIETPIVTIGDAMRVAISHTAKRLEDNRVLISVRAAPQVVGAVSQPTTPAEPASDPKRR